MLNCVWVDERADSKVTCLKCGGLAHGMELRERAGAGFGVCEPCMREHMNAVPIVKPKCKECGKPYYPWAHSGGPGQTICMECFAKS